MFTPIIYTVFTATMQYSEARITEEVLRDKLEKLRTVDDSIIRDIYRLLHSDSRWIYVFLMLEIFDYTQREFGDIIGVSQHRVNILRSKGNRIVTKIRTSRCKV